MNRRRLLLSPLLFLIALITVFVGGSSSASASIRSETRVRSFNTVTTISVGQTSSERPGGVEVFCPGYDQFVVGACVATEAAGTAEGVLSSTIEVNGNRFIYGDRVLARAAEESGPLHNFPATYDETILG